MINSQFIIDVLNNYIEYYIQLKPLKEQMKFIREKEYIYTGTGFYLFFEVENITNKYLILTDLIFSGPMITSSELTNSAETNLYFKDGIVDALEVKARVGNYPDRELIDYQLKETD